MSAISIIEPEPTPEPEPVISIAPVPPAQPAAPERPSRLHAVLPIIAVSLAVLASLLSVIGLVVASRTVAGASLVVADARERQVQLARVGTLIGELEALRAREEAALQRMEQFRATQPATAVDVKRAIDDLKRDLAKHDPDSGALSLVRGGQSELAERIGQISLKLERIEKALSATRKASSGAGRAPIS